MEVQPKFVKPLVEVKLSTIPNAGMGLFATDFIEAGTIVAHYGGTIVEGKLDDSSYAFGYTPAMLIRTIQEMDPDNQELVMHTMDLYQDYNKKFENKTLDAKYEKVELGRFANDNRDGLPNAQVTIPLSSFLRMEWRLDLVAIRDIFPGEEIFIKYGDDYWGKEPEPVKSKRKGIPQKRVKLVECGVCGELTPLACPCQQVAYCGKSCQKKDFEKHNKLCGFVL